MPTKTRRFTPRLERFDDRCLPSVSAIQSGDTVQILGDDTSNLITITDNVVIDPLTGEKGVVVNGDGQTWTFGSSVARIQVFAFGGDDTVNYSATGDLTAGRTVTADLGARNDTFNADLNGLNVSSDVDMLLQVLGQGGADKFTVTAQGASVGALASLWIDLHGGKGKEAFTTDYATVTVDPTGLFTHTEAN
jgi:hypothetical protein